MLEKDMNILKEYNVLYVEDNKEISEEMSYFLEPRFQTFSCAYNGKEGVELFKANKPDIIITDIQMPIMNGIDMIEQIRSIDSQIPILITTAFNESSFLLKAINLNVDAYIMKPLNIKELIEKLFKVLEPLELRRKLINKNKELEEINENLESIVKEKTKELEHTYTHDILTGLPNFVSLGKDIGCAEFVYLVLLDISNFSVINKQYGKDFSDNIIQKIADNLESNINAQEKLFKTESDRFVILCKEEEREKVEEFANQIISFFDTHKMLVNELEVSINFSIGITSIRDSSTALVNAEYALDICKSIGSRFYHFYEDDADSIAKAKENIKWLITTKEMVEKDEIVPYFQPISSTQTGEIVKYEVLARGKHDGEIISPYFFINQAERLGLLSSITRMMINKSFDYFKDSEMSFSINITQRDILDPKFLLFLEDKTQRYNIEPSRITFEILENVTIGSQNTSVIEQLKALKTKGFKLAIDDFGVDNSNFSRLIDIDFDYIKLDGVFIKGLVENKKDRIVVAAIVNLAKTLGVETVAEFVENIDICKIVKECGVTMAQGYHIGKPLDHI